MPVNKRKDTGKWGYRHYYHGRNYRKHEWDTKEEAELAFYELQGKLRREISIIDSNISLVEAVNEYLLYSKRVNKGDWRLKAIMSNFRSFIIPFFSADRKLKNITHLDIDSFIDNQLLRHTKKEITKYTIKHYVTDISALFNWAIREEILTVNPMRKVNTRRIRPEKIIKEGHTPVEIKICESVLAGEELLFLRFLKFTGARLTEALSQKWPDIDFINREVIIRGTKTEESLRKIDMSEGLFNTLKELVKYKHESGQYLFHHEDGSRIKRRDKIFKKITEKTGIKITAKSLRDYFCSIVGTGDDKYTPDIVTASKLMGHTDLKTTQKYLFSLKDSRIQAVKIFDRIEGISTKVSTGQGVEVAEHGAKPCINLWRCRDSNPGHCEYESHALPPELHRR